MLEPIAPPAAGSGVAGGSVPVVVEQPVDPEDSSHRYRVHRGAIARGGKTIAPEAFRRDLFVLVLDSQGQPLGKKQGSQRRIPIQRTIDMSLICEARIPTRHDDLVILIEIFDRIPTFKCVTQGGIQKPNIQTKSVQPETMPRKTPAVQVPFIYGLVTLGAVRECVRQSKRDQEKYGWILIDVGNPPAEWSKGDAETLSERLARIEMQRKDKVKVGSIEWRLKTSQKVLRKA